MKNIKLAEERVTYDRGFSYFYEIVKSLNNTSVPEGTSLFSSQSPYSKKYYDDDMPSEREFATFCKISASMVIKEIPLGQITLVRDLQNKTIIDIVDGIKRIEFLRRALYRGTNQDYCDIFYDPYNDIVLTKYDKIPNLSFTYRLSEITDTFNLLSIMEVINQSDSLLKSESDTMVRRLQYVNSIFQTSVIRVDALRENNSDLVKTMRQLINYKIYQ